MISRPARVLVAADKFKGSLTAVQVAERVTAGPAPGRTRPGGRDRCPSPTAATARSRRRWRPASNAVRYGSPARSAQPGDGRLRAARAAPRWSRWRRRPASSACPRASSHRSRRPRTAPASCCGPRWTRARGRSSSASAAAPPPTAAPGMLAALGARVPGRGRRARRPGRRRRWRDLASADLSGLDPRFTDVDFVLASDVDNPLTGPKGAPAVYGPQKGASPEDVATLDAALAHYASVLEQSIGPKAAECAACPGAGARGRHRLRGAGRLGATLPPRHRGHARRAGLRAGAGAGDPGDHR